MPTLLILVMDLNALNSAVKEASLGKHLFFLNYHFISFILFSPFSLLTSPLSKEQFSILLIPRSFHLTTQYTLKENVEIT